MRTAMLTLLLLLITLSAAYIGSDDRFFNVLRPASDVPVDSSSSVSKESVENITISGEQSEDPPRFVADEPMQTNSSDSSRHVPSTPSAVSRYQYVFDVTSEVPYDFESSVASSVSSSASSLPQSSSSEPVMDPSSVHKASSDVQSQSESRAPAKTEEDIAEPYLMELASLIERASASLDELYTQAQQDYYSLSTGDPSQDIATVASDYLVRLEAIEQQTDDEAERIISQLENALYAVDLPNTACTTARESYQAVKDSIYDRFFQLFNLSVE